MSLIQSSRNGAGDENPLIRTPHYYLNWSSGKVWANSIAPSPAANLSVKTPDLPNVKTFSFETKNLFSSIWTWL